MVGNIKQGEENEMTSYEKILETINFIPKIKLKEKINRIKYNMKCAIDKNIINKLSRGKEVEGSAN